MQRILMDREELTVCGRQFHEETIGQRLWRHIKEEPLVPIGKALLRSTAAVKAYLYALHRLRRDDMGSAGGDSFHQSWYSE